MIKIKYILGFIITVTLFSCKQNVTQKDYPDADAVYIKLSKEYTLNEDGTINYHYTHEMKLFSYLAFNSKYGETFIVYNPEKQKLKINKSLTVTEKGNEISIPDNAKNEVLPGFAVNAPAYNYLREMVVSHTGLERDATINLDYEIDSQKDYMPTLMGNEVINSSSPAKEYEIKIRIPKSRKLYYKLLNSDVKPDISNNGNEQIYTWEFRNVPAQPLELMQPEDKRHLIRLVFSTSEDIGKLAMDFMNQPAFKFDLGDEIKKEADELKKDNKDNLKLILALQKKVVEEFNYYPVPPVYAGYRCRTANEIWKSNGGTEMEKAVLLTSLLKNAGIKTEMIAVSKPYFDVNDKIGMLFDNFVVKAYYGNNDEIYLSPVHTNDNNMIYDLQGDLYYPINNDAKISTLPKGDYSNQIQIKGTFNLSTDNSLTGNAEVKVTDKFNKYLKYLLNPEAAKGLIANANEAKLLSSDKNSSVINLTIENKKAYKKLKNYMFFDLPEATNGINTWGLEQQIEKREAPLELQSNIDESYEYEIVMPEGFKLATGNFNQNIKNNAGFVKISIEQKGNSLIVKKEIRINNKVIEVKDYVDFRKLVNTWRNKQYRELIINN